MATFGSSELARRVADDLVVDETEEASTSGIPDSGNVPVNETAGNTEAPLAGPKPIRISEQSSILGLKGELFKRRAELSAGKQQNLEQEYVGGKRSVLTVKKDERAALLKEASDRTKRLGEMERELQREEREQIEQRNRKLKEKEAVYEALRSGEVLTYQDNSPVDFMVDFTLKKKLEEEKHSASRGGAETQAKEKKRGEAEHYDPEEEQRVYGVSHKKFSADEETRQKQLKELLEMTKQTDATRRREAEESRKRAIAKHEKMNKLRVKNGLEPLPLPEPEPEPSQEELEAIPLPEPVESPMEKYSKMAKSTREWDRGKGQYMSWIQQQRETREDDFRPPDSYNY